MKKKEKETKKGISKALEANKYTTIFAMELKSTQQWAPVDVTMTI